VHELRQHTVAPSDWAQFESFAQIAPRGCIPCVPPALVAPPELVEPPVLVAPPALVEPPELVEPPIEIPVPPLPPDDAPDVPELPPLLSFESESSELHPTEPARAIRMNQGVVIDRDIVPVSGGARPILTKSLDCPGKCWLSARHLLCCLG
jgi:hypothetical protein